MTIIVGIAAYIFGPVSGVFLTSWLIAGKKMDEVLRWRTKRMSDYNIEIETEPFSWNDKMAQLAIEDFDSIRDLLQYCQRQSIGLALAKLRMIEDGELNVRINDGRKD